MFLLSRFSHRNNLHPRLPVPASAELSSLLSTSPAVTCRRIMTAMDEAHLQMFRDEAAFYNRIVLGSLLPGGMWQQLPNFLQKWLRNYIAGVLIYFASCFLWCFFIYYWKRNVDVARDAMPSKRAMLMQIYTTMKSMPWFCALPTITEYMVENGWTKCFPTVADVGFLAYALYLIIYLAILEFAIYWIHRELHEIQLLYKYLHSTHHIYNKQNTLSPFAGMASHPIDGILQAVPHMAAVFIVPIHFRTHIFLIFFEAIWTANIHDCIHGKLWPIMGAGYHTLHHTTYRHNYGHYTIWMDWMFGTLKNPIDEGLKLM